MSALFEVTIHKSGGIVFHDRVPLDDVTALAHEARANGWSMSVRHIDDTLATGEPQSLLGVVQVMRENGYQPPPRGRRLRWWRRG